MKTRAVVAFGMVGSVFLLGGCLNMPTQPSQITGAYVSPVKYASYTCAQLALEQAALARRENELVSAQDQRIKSSKVQAFWVGYGSGDGLEASELADTRGDETAVRNAMASKQCR